MFSIDGVSAFKSDSAPKRQPSPKKSTTTSSSSSDPHAVLDSLIKRQKEHHEKGTSFPAAASRPHRHATPPPHHPRPRTETVVKPISVGSVCGKKAPITNSVKKGGGAARQKSPTPPPPPAATVVKEVTPEDASSPLQRIDTMPPDLLSFPVLAVAAADGRVDGQQQEQQHDTSAASAAFDFGSLNCSALSAVDPSAASPSASPLSSPSLRLRGLVSGVRASHHFRRASAGGSPVSNSVEAAMAEKRKRIDVRAGIADALYGRLIQTAGSSANDGHGRAARSVVRPSQVAKLTAGWIAATSAGNNHEALSLVEYLQDENSRIEKEAAQRREKQRREQAELEASMLVSPVRRAARDDFDNMRRAELSALDCSDDNARIQGKPFGPKRAKTIEFEKTRRSFDSDSGRSNSSAHTAAAPETSRTVSSSAMNDSGRDVQFRYFMAHGKLPEMPVGGTRLSLLLSTRLQQFKPDDDDE